MIVLEYRPTSSTGLVYCKISGTILKSAYGLRTIHKSSWVSLRRMHGLQNAFSCLRVNHDQGIDDGKE
jgi:hypothetical protein